MIDATDIQLSLPGQAGIRVPPIAGWWWRSGNENIGQFLNNTGYQ